MTILSELVGLYERMRNDRKVPEPGYSIEKISFSLVIDAEGEPLRLSDIRSLTGKKPFPIPMSVPAAVTRTVGIKPNRFWDKTAYVFGVTAVEDTDADDNTFTVIGQGKRTVKEHTSFINTHLELLKEEEDPGLYALRRFLENWEPEKYRHLDWPIDALDKNIVFQFDYGHGLKYLHNCPTVLSLITVPSTNASSLCLVTGEMEPASRLHPSIKGVIGAKSSGASLVSYNDDAYESFGKSQGYNAPVSEYAAFAYGSALNALLQRKPAHSLEQNVRIGDTTVVFWAEAEKAEKASFHELLMGKILSPPPDDESEMNKLRAELDDIAQGRATNSSLNRDTKIFILGLAPNAARLSVRFWHPSTFGEFTDNVRQFWTDLCIEPTRGWKGPPAVWSLLYETAIRVDSKPKPETIPPLLGGEIMRAVLGGKPLPRMLLAAVVRRVRADGEINGRRAAICKAVINRAIDKFHNYSYSEKEAIPVSLDPDNLNPAYRLGRLFAVLERAQSAALPGVNATIKDRYFAAASATPARVFPLLIKNTTHHLTLLKKGENGGLGHWLEKEIGTIWLGLDVDMPAALTLEDQGRFIAGYYHQRWTKSDKITKTNNVANET